MEYKIVRKMNVCFPAHCPEPNGPHGERKQEKWTKARNEPMRQRVKQQSSVFGVLPKLHPSTQLLIQQIFTECLLWVRQCSEQQE